VKLNLAFLFLAVEEGMALIVELAAELNLMFARGVAHIVTILPGANAVGLGKAAAAEPLKEE